MRRFRTLLAGPIVVCLTTISQPAFASLPSTHAKWRSLDTPNFRVVGDVSARTLPDGLDRRLGSKH